MVRRLMLTCMVALYDTLPSTTVFMVAVSIVTLVFEREAKPYIDPFLRCDTRALVEHSLLSDIMTVVKHSMLYFTILPNSNRVCSPPRSASPSPSPSPSLITHHPSPTTPHLLTRHPPNATLSVFTYLAAWQILLFILYCLLIDANFTDGSQSVIISSICMVR